MEVEKSKKKEIGFISKISNDLLNSAKEANEAILKARKDKEVTMALLSDTLVQNSETRSEKKEKEKNLKNQLTYLKKMMHQMTK